MAKEKIVKPVSLFIPRSMNYIFTLWQTKKSNIKGCIASSIQICKWIMIYTDGNKNQIENEMQIMHWTAQASKFTLTHHLEALYCSSLAPISVMTGPIVLQHNPT